MKKTEYITIGDFSSNNHSTLRMSGGEIAEVTDFRYVPWQLDDVIPKGFCSAACMYI